MKWVRTKEIAYLVSLLASVAKTETKLLYCRHFPICSSSDQVLIPSYLASHVDRKTNMYERRSKINVSPMVK